MSRVLMIAPTPFFSDRGCHVRIYEEAAELGRRGVEVKVVTYPLGQDPPGIAVTRAARIVPYRRAEAGPSWRRLPLDAAGRHPGTGRGELPHLGRRPAHRQGRERHLAEQPEAGFGSRGLGPTPGRPQLAKPAASDRQGWWWSRTWREMTKVEGRMTKEARSPKSEARSLTRSPAGPVAAAD